VVDALAGFRAAAVAAAVLDVAGLFSAALGEAELLLGRALVRRAAEARVFFPVSSSLAETLGWERWLGAADELEGTAGFLTAPVTGRVGGLVRPPVARVPVELEEAATVGLLAVEEVAAGRRTAVVVPAGFLTRVLPLTLDVSGVAGALAAAAAASAGGASSWLTTSKPASDMASGYEDRVSVVVRTRAMRD
jgi:hypothetical protein